MNRHLYEIPDIVAEMLDAWLGKGDMPKRPFWVTPTDWSRLLVVTQSLAQR